MAIGHLRVMRVVAGILIPNVEKWQFKSNKGNTPRKHPHYPQLISAIAAGGSFLRGSYYEQNARSFFVDLGTYRGFPFRSHDVKNIHAIGNIFLLETNSGHYYGR